MTSEEIEKLGEQVLYELNDRGGFANALDLKLTAARIIATKVDERIQFALAERTEQCAKICDGYRADLQRVFTKRSASADSELGQAFCDGINSVAAEIRALNQPENKL